VKAPAIGEHSDGSPNLGRRCLAVMCSVSRPIHNEDEYKCISDSKQGNYVTGFSDFNILSPLMSFSYV
jgi:hypothetical protein